MLGLRPSSASRCSGEGRERVLELRRQRLDHRRPGRRRARRRRRRGRHAPTVRPRGARVNSARRAADHQDAPAPSRPGRDARSRRARAARAPRPVSAGVTPAVRATESRVTGPHARVRRRARGLRAGRARRAGRPGPTAPGRGPRRCRRPPRPPRLPRSPAGRPGAAPGGRPRDCSDVTGPGTPSTGRPSRSASCAVDSDARAQRGLDDDGAARQRRDHPVAHQEAGAVRRRTRRHLAHEQTVGPDPGEQGVVAAAGRRGRPRTRAPRP